MVRTRRVACSLFTGRQPGDTIQLVEEHFVASGKDGPDAHVARSDEAAPDKDRHLDASRIQ